MLMVVLWAAELVPMVELLPTIVMSKSGNVEKKALKALPGPPGDVCVLEAITLPRGLSSVTRMAKVGTIRASNNSMVEGRNADRRRATGGVGFRRVARLVIRLPMVVLLRLDGSGRHPSSCSGSGRQAATSPPA